MNSIEDPLEASGMLKSATIYRNSEFNYIYVCYHCGYQFTNSLDTLTHVESHFDSAVEAKVNIGNESLVFGDDRIESVHETQHTTGTKMLTKNVNRVTFSDVNEPGDLVEYTIVEQKYQHSKQNGEDVSTDFSDDRLGYSEPIVKIETDKCPPKKDKEKCRKICDICSSSFSTKENLILHMRRQHIGQPKVEQPMFDCDKCNRKIEGTFAFLAHQYGHLINDGRVNDSENDHILQVSLKRYLNDSITCDNSANNTTYGCKICNQISVKHHYGARRHILMQHIHLIKRNRKKQHPCDDCGKEFALTSNLRAHMRTHSSEKPYKCNVCNKSFSHSSYMKYHEKIHTGSQPYQCPTCGRTFRTNSKLNFHIKCHANPTTKCPICNKELKEYRLKLHIRNVHESEHRPHKCPVCTQAFKTAKTLRTHSYRHSDEKRFECRLHCKERFTSSSSRRAHERSKHQAH